TVPSYSAVKLKCATVECSSSSSMCPKPDEMPAGYVDCMVPTDTRMDALKCDKNYVFYDTMTKKFLETKNLAELRCWDGGLDKNKWYLFDGPEEMLEVGEHLHAVCMRKQCNSCKAFTEDANNKPTFTDGNANDCAKLTCSRGVWNVKTDATAAFKQYAGEILCSSKTTTSGKWLMDNTTAVVDAVCVTKDEMVKCTEA
ncbi:hypothetical protein PMAYCL1PPCAC_04374, partial [Pristionchus mayeri]